MKKQLISKNMRKYVIAAICVIAAAAGMTGGFATHQIREQKIQEQAKAEMEQLKKEEELARKQEEQEAKEASANINAKKNAAKTDTGKDQKKTNAGQAADIISRNNAQTEVLEEDPDLQAAETAANIQAAEAVEPAPEIAFTDESSLAWPVNGNIILDYDMEKMVYFATLEQYKYNPAVLIQAEVNEKVGAAAAGKIVDISTNEETGQTVSMDIGGGYQLKYGQLKEVEYALGDTVEQGAVIGYISEPTKYFVVEGAHLYFSMTKDGENVDPLEFIRSE